MLEKWIIWGSGHIGQELYDYLLEQKEEDNVIAIVDSDKNKWRTIWNGYNIQSPDILRKMYFDKLIIAVASWEPINQYIQKEYGIQQCFIDNYMFLQKRDMLKIYESEKYKTEELVNQLGYIKNNPLDVFNACFKKQYFDLKVNIYQDKNKEMFYVFHHGKKMYFPRRYSENEIVNYYRHIVMEQDIRSPHRYQSDDFFVEEGEVVLDAGVAEGNFSLEVVDKVKSLYIIEADEEWIEALENTFEPYKNKVHIIQKYLTDRCDEGCVTIDELAKMEAFTSIKMDIEGAEIDALKGGEKTFCIHCVKAFICCYHREDDFNNIAQILKNYGYDVTTTEGYMAFSIYEAWKKKITPKLVRGIIRAKKL